MLTKKAKKTLEDMKTHYEIFTAKMEELTDRVQEAATEEERVDCADKLLYLKKEIEAYYKPKDSTSGMEGAPLTVWGIAAMTAIGGVVVALTGLIGALVAAQAHPWLMLSMISGLTTGGSVITAGTTSALFAYDKVFSDAATGSQNILFSKSDALLYKLGPDIQKKTSFTKMKAQEEKNQRLHAAQQYEQGLYAALGPQEHSTEEMVQAWKELRSSFPRVGAAVANDGLEAKFPAKALGPKVK